MVYLQFTFRSACRANRVGIFISCTNLSHIKNNPNSRRTVNRISIVPSLNLPFRRSKSVWIDRVLKIKIAPRSIECEARDFVEQFLTSTMCGAAFRNHATATIRTLLQSTKKIFSSRENVFQTNAISAGSIEKCVREPWQANVSILCTRNNEEAEGLRDYSLRR